MHITSITAIDNGANFVQLQLPQFSGSGQSTQVQVVDDAMKLGPVDRVRGGRMQGIALERTATTQTRRAWRTDNRATSETPTGLHLCTCNFFKSFGKNSVVLLSSMQSSVLAAKVLSTSAGDLFECSVPGNYSTRGGWQDARLVVGLGLWCVECLTIARNGSTFYDLPRSLATQLAGVKEQDQVLPLPNLRPNDVLWI